MGLGDGQSSAISSIVGALAFVLQAILSVIFSILGLFSTLISSLPLVLAALAITLAMAPWVVYHDSIIEQAELGMRGTIYPVWRDYVREPFLFIRQLYNPLICWWNALNWWGYGMVREVLLPTIKECSVKPLFLAAGSFVEAVGEDILLYIAKGDFLTRDADFSRISPRGIALFQAWVNIYYCACSDLADIVFVIPILNPLILIPPALPLMLVLIPFSGQWLDPKTWCTIEFAFNAAVAATQEAIRLFTQIVNLLGGLTPPNTPFIRPDLRNLVDRLCPMISCAVRSMENAIQLIWDRYIPFNFLFTDYLCILDSLACILLKTIALFARILINIDRAVVYPADTFWEETIKPDMIEVLNLWAAPTAFPAILVPRSPSPLRYTMTNYFYNTTSENTPLGLPNPVFGHKRFVECLCTFITRTICDPADVNTGCYSSTAQNLLMGFDFCCLTNTLFVLAVDIITGLIEFSLHLSKGPDDFFLFADAQPFTTVLEQDLVNLTRCIFSFFGLIPVVGTCIRELLVEIVQYLLSMIDFSFRVLIGLLTLPYFYIALPGTGNFVSQANLALDFFVNVHENLIRDAPGSLKNCFCVILNNGFPVPPIPCSSCVVGGFTTPPAFKKRFTLYDKQTGVVTSPMTLLHAAWGVPKGIENGAEYAMTPMIRYTNHTTNPISLYHMISANAKTMSPKSLPFQNMDEFNTYMDRKKDDLLSRWARIKTCQDKHIEARRLVTENHGLFLFRQRRGDYDCDADEALRPRYQRPSTMLPPMGSAYVHSFVYSPTSDKPAKFRYLNPEDEDNHTVSSGGSATRAPGEEEERVLTTQPTQPPTIGCSPTPPCFDLCCIVRTSLELIVHIIEFLARFMNGMIQGNHVQQGTHQDFPYFTGELESQGRPTFESDFVTLILKLFAPIRCACQVLNLIIPVVPSAFTAGRPDVCCFVQRLAELIANIFMVIIQAINSLAMGGSTDFVYFKDTTMFLQDVNVLFDITLSVVDCLCILARAVFPLDYIPGFADATNFDICCLAQAILVTVIEIARTILAIVISIALIGVETNMGGNSAFCFWRLDQVANHNCGGTLDNIGLIKNLDVVIDSFLPKHGEQGGACYAHCNSDNGATGIVPCLCQIFNTLIPFRDHPDKATNCNADPATRNCPRLDFCCPFSKLGFVLADSLKFLTRAMAALWQSWEGGLPEFFVNYIWCDEGRIPPCSTAWYAQHQIPFNNLTMALGGGNFAPDQCTLQQFKKVPNCVGVRPVLDNNNTIVYKCGEYTCGALNIVIADIADPQDGLLAKCLCQIFSLLDFLLSYIFHFIQIAFPFAGWPCCFCGGFTSNDGFCNVNTESVCHQQSFGRSSGVLPALSYVIEAVLKAGTRLVRAFPLYCYWNPNGDQPPSKIDETWIFSFLAPTADAICIGAGNMICFAQSMFFLPQTCLSRGEKFAGGILRWVFEVVFRVIGFIEAFIESFLPGKAPQTCVGPSCDQKPGSKDQSANLGSGAPPVSGGALGNMLVILLSIPIDLLIGDGDVACTTICPTLLNSVPAPTACGCWNISPNYGANSAITNYVFTTSGCVVQHVRVNDSMTVTGHVGADFGDTSGCCASTVIGWAKQSPLPVCQNVDDIPRDQTGYPGSCAALAACRPDALPSTANDPETPPNLSAAYRGALDGIVMALTRYLRCFLDNLIGCDAMGENCKSLGLILYPAILIFSLSWQILGGFIRFLAAMIVFFFSLFTPPQGSSCSCWENSQKNGFDMSLTRFYRQVGGLCYPCNTLDNQCDNPVDFQTVSGQGCSYFQRKCAPYCPVWQLVQNPTWTAAQAHSQCLIDYANVTNKNFPFIQKKPMDPSYDIALSAQMVCSGVKDITTTLWQTVSTGTTTIANKTWGQFNVTTASDGWCFPPAQWSGGGTDIGGTSWTNYIVEAACPAPACQDPAVTKPVCGINAYGLWPCGAHSGSFSTEGIWDCSYPGSPLVTCGALQIISNFLDVFAAFVAIFTTPVLIPQKRSDNFGMDFSRFSMPAKRESIQSFKKRYNGVVTGLDAGGANIAETLTAAVYDYDLSDCYDDPMTCHCRNLDIPNHCYVNDATGEVVFGPLGKRRSTRQNGTVVVETNMTVSDLTNMMSSQVFVGTSVCDHVIGDHANKTWEEIAPDNKNQYMKCLDKVVQGTRMNHVADVVPVDIMYNSNAPMTLVHNMFHKARTAVRARHERAQSKKRRNTGREEFDIRFPKYDEQLKNRSLFAKQILIDKYRITPQRSPIFDAAIKADRIWFKYTTGYYNFLLQNMMDEIADGATILPSPDQALAELKYAAWDLKNVIVSQHYGKVWTATVEATNIASREVGKILDEGVIEFATRTYNQYAAARRSTYRRSTGAKAEAFERAIRASPLYKLWYPDNTTAAFKKLEADEKPITFWQHLTSVVAFQRQHWQTESFNFFNADIKLWSLGDIIKNRFSKPDWKPHQLDNLEKLKRVYYQAYDRIWPGYLSSDVQERFLFNSNCPIADRAFNLSIRAIDYCANEYIPNLNLTRKRSLLSTGVGKYFDDVSRFRSDTYYGYRNRPRFTEEHSVPGDPTSWIRPRLIIPNATEHRSHRVDPRVYKRGSLANKQHGPAGFNLFYWLIGIAEDITGYAIGAHADTWYSAVRAWILNPNTDIADYPNVGLAYAVRFEFVCHFPESFNCSIGTGLETALLWVSVGFLALFLIAGYVLPILLVPFSFIGLGLSYWIVLSAVAWHFPMACLIMFPAFPIPLGVGLPSCLMDQLLAFLDKWVTNCYSPLLIPAYMIAGDVCPVDPMQAIDFLNCADVGVSDGLQNILYLGFWVLGQGFCDVAMKVVSAFVQPFIPGAATYLDVTLNSFKTAGDTNRKRMTFCFFATLPTLLLPGVAIFVVGLAVAYVLPQLLLLANALVTLFFASPIAAAVPGGGDAREAWFGPDPETVLVAAKKKPPSLLSAWIRSAVYGKEKTE